MSRSPEENVAYEFLLALSVVSCIFCSSYLDSFGGGCPHGVMVKAMD